MQAAGRNPGSIPTPRGGAGFDGGYWIPLGSIQLTNRAMPFTAGRDRVEPAGLRRPARPQHRTYGFPHPAVEPGGLPVPCGHTPSRSCRDLAEAKDTVPAHTSDVRAACRGEDDKHG